jgi:hypothetical protein
MGGVNMTRLTGSRLGDDLVGRAGWWSVGDVR